MKGFVISLLLIVLIIVSGLYLIDKATPIALENERPVRHASDRSSQETNALIDISHEITINLTDPKNSSKEKGKATLTDIGRNRTEVKLEVGGAPVDTLQPAHIYNGNCEARGKVRHSLHFPKNGLSQTVLNVPLSMIRGSMPLSIKISKSLKEPGVYYACGNITNNYSAMTTPITIKDLPNN